MTRLALIAVAALACSSDDDKARERESAARAMATEPPRVSGDAAVVVARDATVVAAIESGTDGGAPPAATAKILQIDSNRDLTCARRSDGRVRCWGGVKHGLDPVVVAAVPVELPDISNAASIHVATNGYVHVVTTAGTVLTVEFDPATPRIVDESKQFADAIDVRVAMAGRLVLTRRGDVYLDGMSAPEYRNVIALDTNVIGEVALLHRNGPVSWFASSRDKGVVRGLADAETLFGNGCARRRNEDIACWFHGKPTTWDGPRNIVERAGGDLFSCDLASSVVACTTPRAAGPSRGAVRRTVVKLPARATAITASQLFACALLADGEVACWGSNHYGSVGDGTLIDRAAPVVVAGLTSAQALPVTDGSHAVQESAVAMSWDGMPTACKRPEAITTTKLKLAKVVSAYAQRTKTSTHVVLADFRIDPASAGVGSVRGKQIAIDIALSRDGRGTKIDRGRYQTSTRKQRAEMYVLRAGRGAETVGDVDLVVEHADATWICGQLLGGAIREPFAARFAP